MILYCAFLLDRFHRFTYFSKAASGVRSPTRQDTVLATRGPRGPVLRLDWILMTLQSYDPNMMDEFALQLLDLAATVREMANRCRQHGIHDFAVHDKKALQWQANLQKWARRAQAELEIRILDSRASRRAAGANE